MVICVFWTCKYYMQVFKAIQYRLRGDHQENYNVMAACSKNKVSEHEK